MSSKLVVLAATALSVAGCSHAADSSRDVPGEHADQRITKGADDDGDPAVVALVDEAGNVVCSGTLISPHVVLTAAHCTQDLSVRGNIEVLFGNDAATGTRVDISDVHAHPTFDGVSFVDDIALLALATSATTTPIAPLATTPDAKLTGAPLRVVGFGTTSGALSDAGRKRQGTSTVAIVTPTTFTLTAAPSQPCNGDSGGPAFLAVGGTDFVAGITSHGDGACTMRDTETRVDGYGAFIAAYLASSAEGAAHAGERCFYDGHCDKGACVAAADEPRITYCAPPCAGPADCPSNMTCTDSSCRYALPTPGAFGATCTGDADCFATVCNSLHVCSRRCVSSAADCPSGFECQHLGGSEYSCMAAAVPQGSSSSCNIARRASPSSAAALLAVLGGGLTLIASRRRARRSTAGA